MTDVTMLEQALAEIDREIEVASLRLNQPSCSTDLAHHPLSIGHRGGSLLTRCYATTQDEQP